MSVVQKQGEESKAVSVVQKQRQQSKAMSVVSEVARLIGLHLFSQ